MFKKIISLLFGIVIIGASLYIISQPWHIHDDTGEFHSHNNSSKQHSHIIFLED